MGFFRFFSSSACCRNVSASTLALLRKKTGYTFANIRKALELNDNDATKAEKWLMEQAKALGWSAAGKLQNRKVTQGLIGMAVSNKKLAMVELNCETDFVSRNEKFKSFTELVAKTCLQQPVLNPGETTKKVYFTSEEIGKLKADNDSLADHLALLIGSVGENMVLKRGFCYETNEKDVNIAVAVHPPPENSEVFLGKYASFFSYKMNSNNNNNEQLQEPLETVCNQLCRHIIGMNPTAVGEFTENESIKKQEESTEMKTKEGEEESTEKTDESLKSTSKGNELVHQEFLFDNSLSVGALLKESGITVLDFHRIACGEMDSEEVSSAGDQETNEKNVKVALG